VGAAEEGGLITTAVHSTSKERERRLSKCLPTDSNCTIGGESQLSADHRGILIVPGVITHSAISPPNTHLHPAHTEVIINQIVGAGSQCTIIHQAESYISFRAESWKVLRYDGRQNLKHLYAYK